MSRTKPAKAEALARLLTEAAYHLKEHASDYQHVSPADLPARLWDASDALAKSTTGGASTPTGGAGS